MPENVLPPFFSIVISALHYACNVLQNTYPPQALFVHFVKIRTTERRQNMNNALRILKRKFIVIDSQTITPEIVLRN